MKARPRICSVCARSACGTGAAANPSVSGIVFAVVAMIVITGCASAPLPSEAVGVSTVAVSSTSVEIHRPRLVMKTGELKLEAYAFRQWKAETTANTHVDIVYLNAAGNEIARETTNFHPRSLPASGVRGKPHAYLLVPIRIPANTRAIEVRAHEGPHETPPRISTPN